MRLRSFLFLSALSLLCSASLTPFCAKAQPLAPSGVQPIESWSQMWNATSVYFGTITASTVGNQLDSVAANATANFSTSTVQYGRTGTGKSQDTVYVSPLPGNGKISFFASCYNAGAVVSVNAVHYVTLTKSIDGIHYVQAPGTVTQIATCTSANTVNPITVVFDLSDKQGRFWNLHDSVVGNRGSIFCSYDFLKPYQYQLLK